MYKNSKSGFNHLIESALSYPNDIMSRFMVSARNFASAGAVANLILQEQLIRFIESGEMEFKIFNKHELRSDALPEISKMHKEALGLLNNNIYFMRPVPCQVVIHDYVSYTGGSEICIIFDYQEDMKKFIDFYDLEIVK